MRSTEAFLASQLELVQIFHHLVGHRAVLDKASVWDRWGGYCEFRTNKCFGRHWLRLSGSGGDVLSVGATVWYWIEWWRHSRDQKRVGSYQCCQDEAWVIKLNIRFNMENLVLNRKVEFFEKKEIWIEIWLVWWSFRVIFEMWGVFFEEILFEFLFWLMDLFGGFIYYCL